MDEQGFIDAEIPEAPTPPVQSVEPDELTGQQEALSAQEVAAKRTRGSVINPNSNHPLAAQQYPRVTDDATFAAVPMGQKFIDPDEKIRIKPWRVASDRDFERIPEGAAFVDPQGKLRIKPKFEPVSYTTQTLYDMALTPKQKRSIMEAEYPGKVKEDAKGFYAVDDEGIFHRPGYGKTALAGGATAMALPVAGAVVGTIGGGAAGAMGGPAGVFVGGMAGGAAGGYSGQWFNDFMLQSAGHGPESAEDQGLVHQRQVEAGLTGVLGGGLGRGAAMIVPSMKEGISRATVAGPTVLRKILGASEADLRMAKEIADKGTTVPPSTVFKEAPHLQNVSERFHPAMDTSNPSLRSIEQHYETGATKILDDLGTPEFQAPSAIEKTLGTKAETPSLREPGAGVPVKRVGEALRERAIADSAGADSAFREVIEQRKAAAATNAVESSAQREQLLAAQVQAKEAADKLVQQGLDEMGRTADAAIKVANAGHNSGDLWQAFAAQLVAVKTAITSRAKVMYDLADELAGGVKPNSAGLPMIAENFLEQLPGDFQNKYPDIVKKLRDLAGKQDPETGEWLKAPVVPTFGELRNLRSLLRGNADWHTLSPDLRNGTYKFFSKRVDDALRDIKSVPALEPAVKQLDLADEFYRKNMPVFEAKQIEGVMRGLEAGLPADPNELYRVVVREGHTDLTNRIRGIVGENIWSGVRAADMRTILDNSKDLVPGVTDGRKFVAEVLDRHRSGLLDSVHGKAEADKIRKLAEEVRALTNDRVPIQVRDGDTVMQTIQRARDAAVQAKAVANKDPMGALKKEMANVEREAKRQPQIQVPDPANPGQMKLVARKDDPLWFLYEPTVGASEAAKKILSSEDLLFAAAHRFGKDSKEFNMLRQAYAQQVLQGTINPAERLAIISPELQALMFPGVTGKQMKVLADEMNFLTSSKLFSSGDFGGALSATAKVEHPIAGRLVSGAMKLLPGPNMAARTALGAYYKMVTDWSANNPALFNYLLRGLGGTPEEKQAVRNILTKHAQRYAAMGAGVGEALYQKPADEKPRRPAPRVPPTSRSMQELSRP